MPAAAPHPPRRRRALRRHARRGARGRGHGARRATTTSRCSRPTSTAGSPPTCGRTAAPSSPTSRASRSRPSSRAASTCSRSATRSSTATGSPTATTSSRSCRPCARCARRAPAGGRRQPRRRARGRARRRRARAGHRRPGSSRSTRAAPATRSPPASPPALARGSDLTDALRLGTAAGALNVTRRGLGTGSRDEIERLAEHVDDQPLTARGGTVSALITNDDGIASAGIRTLAQAALDAGLEVTVAAPTWDSSGASASLTAGRARRALPGRGRELEGLDGVAAFAVEAAPAFIVRAATTGAFGDAARPRALGHQPRAQHRPRRPALRHGRGRAHRRARSACRRWPSPSAPRRRSVPLGHRRRGRGRAPLRGCSTPAPRSCSTSTCPTSRSRTCGGSSRHAWRRSVPCRRW